MPPSEATRLARLYSLDLLGREPDERFDRITRLAARALDVPIALVTLLDDSSQFMCSAFGIDPIDGDRSDSFCTHALADDAPILVVEDTLEDPRIASSPFVTGEPYVRFYAGAVISTPDGHPLGTLCVIDTVPRSFDEADRSTLLDFAHLVDHELRYTSLAMTDMLTSLSNRRALEAATERFIGLSRRRDDAVSLVFADINDLKLTNDNDGHPAGDLLLQRAARIFSSCTRSSDVVARVGGDEFVVLLYGADTDQALGVVETIEAAITEDSLAAPNDPALSVSFGVASLEDDDDGASLIARADGAMYAAKRAG